MQKIVYYGRIDARFMSTWQKVHFMDELEHYGIQFCIFNPYVFRSWDEANSELVKFIKETNPVMFFTLIRSTKALYVSTVEAIKKLGIPTLFFVTDSLATPYEDKEIAKHFDLVWVTEPETKYLYDKWGINSFLAPYAANPFFFKPYPTDYKSAVCFIGRAHGSRANMINSLSAYNDVNIDIFDKYNDNDDIYKQQRGSVLKGFSTPTYKVLFNWCKYSVGRKMILSALKNRNKTNQMLVEEGTTINHFASIPFELIPQKYSEYKVALSSTSYHNTDVLKKPVGVINLRSFEIPMSGGLQICRYNSYLAEQFEEDKEIIFYRDSRELHSKAEYYIHRASNNEIADIKNAARKRAELDHTWYKRFEIAFNRFGIKFG